MEPIVIRVPPATLQPPAELVTGAAGATAVRIGATAPAWTGGRACDWTRAVGTEATFVVGEACGALEAMRSLDENGFEKGCEKRAVSELQADATPPIKLTRAIRETATHRPACTRSLMTQPSQTQLR